MGTAIITQAIGRPKSRPDNNRRAKLLLLLRTANIISYLFPNFLLIHHSTHGIRLMGEQHLPRKEEDSENVFSLIEPLYIMNGKGNATP